MEGPRDLRITTWNGKYQSPLLPTTANFGFKVNGIRSVN